MTSEGGNKEGDVYLGNIWGRKWTVLAGVFILIVLGIATCRYIMIQPDQLLIPEEMENVGNANEQVQ